EGPSFISSTAPRSYERVLDTTPPQSRTSGVTASGSHLGLRRPSAREDKDDKPEPVETISQCGVACDATADDYPGCDGATPSATDNPRLGEKRTAPGRSWAPRSSGSAPSGPSADTFLVPEWACAGVAAALLSRLAVWLATSVVSSVAAP